MNTTADTITICAKCRHFEPDGAIWYDQYCGHKANRLKAAIDPVSGETMYAYTNALGAVILCDEPRRHARDCNDGLCQNYKAA